MISVSVIMPTVHSPASLLRAARSVFAQEGVSGIELICVDNSPEGRARESFKTLEGEAPLPFRWLHEGRPGVANARNAALPYARGEFIAWLDDDEEAPPHWLAALIAVRKQTGAQAVFGPVRACAPGARHGEFFERLHSRLGPDLSGPCAQSHGIANSLSPRAMFDEEAPFDPAANQTGGEDKVLFAAWRAAGARFAWAAEAEVVEHVDDERARLAPGLKRALAHGQGACATAWAERRLASLFGHMILGALEAPFYGAMALAIVLVSPAKALFMLGRAARAMGRVVWFQTQKFYGEALLQASAPALRRVRA